MTMISRAAARHFSLLSSKAIVVSSQRFAVAPAMAVRSFATTAEKKPADVDPMEVFDMIDTNKDGVLSKEEFSEAVDQMQYQDLLKIKHSLSRNELSYNPKADQDMTLETSGDSVFIRRLLVTIEVAISKIFPAGFGWQTAGTLLDNAGVQANEFAFYLGTGLGDGACVCLGHTIYMLGKKTVTGNEDIDMTAQVQTGFMLGSAAIFSGGIWQPTVNALQAAGWSFNPALAMTGGVASLAFFTGLRLSRRLYGPTMKGIEKPTYANLKADAQLSVAVGGAAGCFLGTDVSYAAANWLRPIVGIEDSMAAITGSVLAGSSTALGFTVIQVGENLAYKKDKLWVD